MSSAAVLRSQCTPTPPRRTRPTTAGGVVDLPSSPDRRDNWTKNEVRAELEVCSTFPSIPLTPSYLSLCCRDAPSPLLELRRS